MAGSMTAPPTLAGYPLLGPLGPCPGGTADRSRHPLDGRPVVVRRLHPHPGAADRARAATQVQHPHLATPTDAGEADGQPFAVLEPLDGAGLASLVADLGPLPAEIAVGFVRQLASGLAAAHAAGIAHGGVHIERVVIGPIKPTGDGRFRPADGATVTLLDLGLVPAGDPADDLRALGELAYHLVVGRPPRADDPPLTELRPDLPADFRVAVNGLLCADPSARPTAAAVADRLTPTAVEPVPAVSDGRRLVGWFVAGAALNLLGAGILAYAYFR
jgi:serine/threonine-protein kinase